MAAFWNLLPVVFLLFIRASRPLPTTLTHSDPPGVPSAAPSLPPPDYYEDGETTPSVTGPPPPDARTLRRCAYSPCLEGQTPCAKLAASSGCLCPGITLHNTPPLAPDLRSVAWNGSEVVLRWCTPNSFVTGFVVTVGGETRRRFGEERRSGSVGAVQQAAEVCVVAVNEAGSSGGSCRTYQPSGGVSRPLTAGLVGGALGLLMLSLLGVLMWRRGRERKHEIKVSEPNATEAL